MVECPWEVASMSRAAMCVMAGLALAAGPLPLLSPEQKEQLRQRPLWGVSEKALQIELRVYGPWHRQVDKTARRLAAQHAQRGEWDKAVECRRFVLEARRMLDGE